MAKYLDEVDGDNKFPNPRLSKTYFLTSVRDFKPEGVRLGIERVSKLFPVKQDPKKAMLTVEFCLMDDLKCRLYELDDKGDYITHKDDITGKEEYNIVIEEVKESDVLMFPMFMPCGTPKEINDEADLTFFPASSSYPLFKLALQNAGELPEDMSNKPFVTNQKELKDALEGFIFLAKCEEIKGNFNYVRMQVEKADL